ncbi:DnaJ domain containing protein, putative [Trypanosoma equiperdum]|uniref:DnaJ domain containing protein, putative n=1 Tax=Trypanosoma equiperdum TaxID=5694 RepID=A0A1G4I9I1_TRYEQ|nr:DnaJ domain containing protein, putative [Trypanosoma equiperdum]
MFRFNQTLRAALATPKDIAAALRVLGLDTNSANISSEAVRAQYLRLARLHHPDISSGDDQKMKIINTAYEMLQSSGALNPKAASTSGTADEDKETKPGDTVENANGGRFSPKSGRRRRRVPDDFADGDRWDMKSTLEWRAMTMMGAGSVSEEELRNPANHPFSHSKFFSFEEDVTIYRMIRGGATIRQVARTLGKAPTFVERRLQNAQFKQRVQYVMRHEKRQGLKERASGTGANSGGFNMTERLFGTTTGGNSRGRGGHRKKEWEPTALDGEVPAYFADMSLEEKGLHARLMQEERRQQQLPSWGVVASKVGRSYSNYARFTGNYKKT